MSRLTPWGRIVQDWLIAEREILGNLADAVGTSSVALSAMMRGTEPVPDEIAEKVAARIVPGGPAGRDAAGAAEVAAARTVS